MSIPTMFWRTLSLGKNISPKKAVAKAEELKPEVFDLGSDDKNDLLAGILDVYKEMEFKPLSFSAEFFQIPQMKKYGGFQGIRDILGGQDATIAFVKALQDTLYDERIAA